MLPSADAVWVGEELARRFGLPSWQLAMSATDANRFVLRFARHLTGRPRVAVMDWCYHGTVDETLAVPRRRPGRPAPRALGPQVDVAETTAVVPFNDVDALDRRLAEGDVACLLMEPALTNIGIVLPDDGYLDGGPRGHPAPRRAAGHRRDAHAVRRPRRLHRRVGPRARLRSWSARPIGGGIPCAAYGMTAEVADRLSGPMLGHEIDVAGVGGTLTGNALATAAIRATLSTCLREEDFAVAVPLAERFTAGVAAVIADARPALARAAARLPRGVLVLPAARATAPPRPPPSTRTSRASCTCGASTAACC